MIKEIDKTLLNDNPFNPKNPFNEKELKLLKISLKKWGFIGTLLVCPDYRNDQDGRFIVIDGNTRYKNIKSKKINCDIITGIENDDDLKEVTLDFTGAVKTRNYLKLLKIYQDLKDRLSEEYQDNFNRIKLTIKKYEEQQQKLKLFDKTVLLKFGDEDSYNDFELIKKRIKAKIYKNNKFMKHLSEIEEKDFLEEKIDKHILDILLKIAKKE